MFSEFIISITKSRSKCYKLTNAHCRGSTNCSCVHAGYMHTYVRYILIFELFQIYTLILYIFYIFYFYFPFRYQYQVIGSEQTTYFRIKGQALNENFSTVKKLSNFFKFLYNKKMAMKNASHYIQA